MNIIQKVFFWIWNWFLIPDSSQQSLIVSLVNSNKHKLQKWFYITVLLNISPFLVSVMFEAAVNSGNVLCILNNGSLPILTIGILATNLVYLNENTPDISNKNEREGIDGLKGKVLVVAVLILIVSAFLYFAQSNFVNSFNGNQLKYSLYTSVILFVYSVSCGRKMFLLQKETMKDYKDAMETQKQALLSGNHNGFTTT